MARRLRQCRRCRLEQLPEEKWAGGFCPSCRATYSAKRRAKGGQRLLARGKPAGTEQRDGQTFEIVQLPPKRRRRRQQPRGPRVRLLERQRLGRLLPGGSPLCRLKAQTQMIRPWRRKARADGAMEPPGFLRGKAGPGRARAPGRWPYRQRDGIRQNHPATLLPSQGGQCASGHPFRSGSGSQESESTRVSLGSEAFWNETIPAPADSGFAGR